MFTNNNKNNKKLDLQDAIYVEMLDTMAEICLYLQRSIEGERNPQTMRLERQYRSLKALSDAVKGREYK